jgi:hydroxymethylpyrimidine/phosphomethylpyrimidine kinase
MLHFCLTIAGSDPSSGAGIQADIRTFDRIGVHPFSAITALTYQSASKFLGYKSLSNELESQLQALFDDYPIKYVKIGMIPDKKSIEIITKYIVKYNLYAVLDPVSISSTGKRLSIKGLEEELEKMLFPLVRVLTPNFYEAAFYSNINITDLKLNSVNKIKECADLLLKKLYPSEISDSKEKAVIIKSAVTEKSTICDILCIGEDGNSKPKFHVFKKPKIFLKNNVHGTGCVFSSAITAYLAKDFSLFDAINLAETFFDERFQKYIELPKEGAITDLGISNERLQVLEQVKEIYSFLSSNKDLSELIPEVRMNISGALPNATEKNDIAAIEGRITIINGYPYASGDVKFGVSDHTARLILEAKKYDKSVDFVMNLKYKEPWISLLLERSNLQLEEIKREQQPTEVKSKEESTMQWIIQKIMNQREMFPDIIWDKGAIGKEPIIRLFGKNSKEMIQKLKVISSVLKLSSEKKH